MKKTEGKLAEPDFIGEEESGDSDSPSDGQEVKVKESSSIPFSKIPRRTETETRTTTLSKN